MVVFRAAGSAHGHRHRFTAQREAKYEKGPMGAIRDTWY
jgi:hypothetical protein